MSRADSPSLFQKGLIVSIAAIAMVAAALLLWRGATILLLAFAGLLLAVALRLPVDLLVRRGMPTALAFVFVFTVLAAVLGALGWLVVPRLTDELGGLQGELVRSFERTVERLEASRGGRFLLENLRRLPREAGQDGQWLSRAAGVMSTFFGALGAISLVLFTGFFLAVDPEVYRKGFLGLFPPGRRKRARTLLQDIHRTLSWWLLGRLVAMAIVAVLSVVGLMLLGVPLALALGVLAGIFSFIPYLGPVLGAVPAVLIALGEGPMQALYVALVFSGIQILENNLLEPIIEHKTVRLPPALGLTAGLVMALLFGVPGLFLSTPLVAVAIVLVRQLYVEEVVGG